MLGFIAFGAFIGALYLGADSFQAHRDAATVPLAAELATAGFLLVAALVAAVLAHLFGEED